MNTIIFAYFQYPHNSNRYQQSKYWLGSLHTCLSVWLMSRKVLLTDKLNDLFIPIFSLTFDHYFFICISAMSKEALHTVQTYNSNTVLVWPG